MMKENFDEDGSEGLNDDYCHDHIVGLTLEGGEGR